MGSSRSEGTPSPRPQGRAPRVPLPVEPSVEELARDWTLSATDLVEVRRCRGDDNRRRFALQLCTLRTYGRFLDTSHHVPLTILTHLNRQLELPPVLFLTDSEREATDSDHQERIRHYLGYHSFDEHRQEQLERWLEARATEGALPLDLLPQAKRQLRSWQVVLPAVSTLERVVASVVARAQQELFARIAGELSPQLRQVLDELLNVAAGD